MSMSLKRSALGAFLSLVAVYYPPGAQCREFMIPVEVSSEVVQFNFPQWGNDFELVDFLAIATTRQTPETPSPIGDSAVQTNTFRIAASFCSPREPTEKSKTVIVATHGIGQARSHWNSPLVPDEYNFVQFAISQGYSVFFYDRLGQGFSERISGFVNQINIQVEILKELTRIVKTGAVTEAIGVPEKVALMGYSFGSYITHAAISTVPDLADAVVLTAVGFNPEGLNINGLVRSFVPRIANMQSSKFSSWDTGYLTWVDKFTQMNTYFKLPFFDEATANFVEQEKQPFAWTEFFTINMGNGGDFDASAFTGAALAITGQNDYIVCDGDCVGIFEEPASTLYQNAQPFVPYLHPNASHNFNFHYNATGAYAVITKFLDDNI
ncbi:Alpha/Beta hydrolase protein [Stachybotrys elegans]|uniref:Alpha/Beta hydrolase protein n=1 Tax=Stachybotrys elegans TaxID=80388 RepID=A0A8K0SXM7_9HYPO|nr:Alpha/Beta hydrolase protein [Stachybotrys elegans]